MIKRLFYQLSAIWEGFRSRTNSCSHISCFGVFLFEIKSFFYYFKWNFFLSWQFCFRFFCYLLTYFQKFFLWLNMSFPSFVLINKKVHGVNSNNIFSLNKNLFWYFQKFELPFHQLILRFVVHWLIIRVKIWFYSSPWTSEYTISFNIQNLSKILI